MYCQECGVTLTGNEKYCPNCGCKLNHDYTSYNNEFDRTAENKRVASLVLGIISLCTVFIGIFAPIGLILAIIGLFLAIKANKKIPNTPAIIINAIGLFLSAIITIFITLIIIFSYNAISNIWDNKYIPEISENYGDF